jgi:hypothetical protein
MRNIGAADLHYTDRKKKRVSKITCQKKKMITRDVVYSNKVERA